MNRIIIINDNEIQEELNRFINDKQQHILFYSDMSQLLLESNPILKEIIDNYEEKHKIKIHTKDGIWFYKSSEVIRFEASNELSKVFLTDKTSTILNVSIDDIEKQLPDFPFIKIHNNHIVNGKFVTRISGDNESKLELTSGDILPVGKPFLNQIWSMIDKNY